MSTPILLVHGIYDTKHIFDKMIKEMNRNGLQECHTMNIVPNDATITFEEMAKQVEGSVQQILLNKEKKQIDIIGFSMGALAAREYLQKSQKRINIRKYISISGPHHGTYWAYLSNKKGVMQLRPNSKFLKDMNENEGNWKKTEVFSIYTILDLMIFPSISSKLINAINIQMKTPLHSMMIYDKAVINSVIGILNQ